jgi:hypothetical protein
LGQPARLLGETAPSHFESYADAALKSNACALPNRSWLPDCARAFYYRAINIDEQGNIRSRGIISEYRNLKRVSPAYARELGLTPVARKAFKLSFERERASVDWVKLAYADDEEPGWN